MKRYFILVLVALISLLGCKVSDGTEIDPNGGKRAIWISAYGNLLESINGVSGRVVIYAAAALTSDKELQTIIEESYFKKKYSKYSVEVSNNCAVITTDIGKTKIVTDGKSFAEGGVWQSYRVSTTSTGESIDIPKETFYGVGENSFTYSCVYEGVDNTNTIESEVSYTKTDGKVSLTIVGTGRNSGKDYTIDFTSKQPNPIVFTNGLLDCGEADIVYTNLANSTTRKFGVKVVGNVQNIRDAYNNVLYTE